MCASARFSILAASKSTFPIVFGFNKDGNLGFPDKNITRPTTVPYCEIQPIPTVIKVSCGFKHSVFMAQCIDGIRIFGSGSNKRGQLGKEIYGEQVNQFTPIVDISKDEMQVIGTVLDVNCSWHNTIVLAAAESNSKQKQTNYCYITGDNKYG